MEWKDGAMAHRTPQEKWQIWNDPEEALRRRESLIERQIREAQGAGEFDNLPGYGKPIPKDPGQDLAPDRWMSNRILKQAGYVPEWIELRKQIAAERDEVVQALATYREQARAVERSNPDLQQLERRYIELATAINKKIDQHNGECPKGQLLTRFVEDATRRW
jgi:hypothetical protein